jgi:signal transduction histidine kinase
MKRGWPRSLLRKMLLSTAAALGLLFALTGWLVQRQALNTASQLLEDEVRSSFQAYESLWRSRASMLASVSRVLAAMSDVRAAFSTGDEATIQDTAGELWSRISGAAGLFLVTDPEGRVIASLGGEPGFVFPRNLPFVRTLRPRFPKQASGFLLQDRQLYQIAVTPVYVQSATGMVLLNTLVAGYRVDLSALSELHEATGGSEFVFATADLVLASTLPPDRANTLVRRVAAQPGARLISDGTQDYALLTRPLLDVHGEPVARLHICRSFDSAGQALATLRRNIVMMLLTGLVVGVALTMLLARWIVGPVVKLDQAAAEVARHNYGHRVAVTRDDELGRLAQTFNLMCDSLQKARADLIRQERISTIGRMATSIVHDLRNPLAAVYGGAEMLVDSDLPPATVRRLAANIYRASKHIQSLLQDLTDLGRGMSGAFETCALLDVIQAGIEPHRSAAESANIAITLNVDPTLEIPLRRGPVERVFSNLAANSIQAMRAEGFFRVSAHIEPGSVIVEVTDSGPGIDAQVRRRLFEPFTTSKNGGLGLGLALSRQTLVDHGGELWEESAPGQGACFLLRFPLPADLSDTTVAGGIPPGALTSSQ